MRRPIDYEKQSSVSLTVAAENEAPLMTVGQISPSLNPPYQAEASIVISVININDNRPEFVPITPRRKHVIFVWEQLPEVGENQTEVQQSNRFCEPIPYKVIDKDCEPGNQEFCCSLALENTFGGMFGLVEEIPNVICALRRPPQPQSYKVTLIASDGKGNGSLTSQVRYRNKSQFFYYSPIFWELFFFSRLLDYSFTLAGGDNWCVVRQRALPL